MLAAHLQRGDVVEVYFEDRGVLRWIMPTIRVGDCWLCRAVERVADTRLDDPGAFRVRSEPIHVLPDAVDVRVLRYQRDVRYSVPSDPDARTHDPQLAGVADLPDIDVTQPELLD